VTVADGDSAKLIVVENPAVQTALGPMVIVAVDQHEPAPLINDELAGRFLPPAARPVVAGARWSPVRRLLFGLTEKRIPGLWAEVLCRKRYLDDQTREALRAGVDAVVILGSGMDTRPYRLAGPGDVPMYEVDLPSNIARKRERLRALYRQVPGNVTLVPLDLETDDLAEALTSAGYSTGAKTLFLGEAVTQYLTERAVRATFEFLAGAGAGSRLVFTYVRQDFLDGRCDYRAPAAYQGFVARRRLWKFGLEPHQVAEFLADYGWREIEQVGGEEFLARYVRPSGRPLDVSDLERAVSAEKV
jgi:methyltransferase (TIGR00027 family)